MVELYLDVEVDFYKDFKIVCRTCINRIEHSIAERETKKLFMESREHALKFIRKKVKMLSKDEAGYIIIYLLFFLTFR